MNLYKFKKVLLFIIASLSCFALITQFQLSLEYFFDSSLFITLINYLSFFTIQIHILVAINSIGTLLSSYFKITRVVINDFASTSIAVYLIVSALVYNLMLRMLWNPQGLMKIVDTLFHLVIPILYLMFWFLNNPKSGLKWKDGFKVLIFPFLYVVYTLLHGAITNFYPYPFLNADQFGFYKVLINCSLLTILFFGITVLLIGIRRFQGKE